MDHDAYVGRIRRLIEEHGWAVQAVAGGGDDLPFAYTVGLAEPGDPELLVAGLPLDVAHRLLNDIVRAAQTGRVALEGGVSVAGADLDGDFSPHVFRLVAMDRVYLSDRYALFNVGRAVLECPLVRALQVVWPDAGGRYPDEAGYDAARHPQPVFARPGVGAYRNDRRP